MNVNDLDQTTALASAEITKMLRASAQIGRFLADRRRQHMYHQAQLSAQRARDLRALISAERALAAPVYRRALDERFWRSTNPQDAAFVYGVATRFANVDPLAEQAASVCEHQAHKMWGIYLRGQSQSPQEDPVTSSDLDRGTIAAVAPRLSGDEPEDLGEVLDQAAEQDRREAASKDPDAQQARDQDKAVNHLLAVLEQHPQVAHIRVETTGEGLELDATDTQGRRLPEASQALSQVASQAAVPDLLARQIGGRGWGREAFEVEVSRPLVAAAASPRPGVDSLPVPGPAGDNAASAASDQVDVKGARAWFERNYGSQGVLLSSTPEAERDKYAITLQAALAAEGYDLDDPPRIVDPSSYKFEDGFMSSVGACEELADWLALDPSDINTRIDPRALPAFHAAWQIVQDGDYPELYNWGWNVGNKSMQAAYRAEALDPSQVRLVGDKPQPGIYLPAMRQAAAAEAAEAGLEVDVYLDHLQPVQRRAVMVGISRSQEDDQFYGPGRARAAQYRVAYAKASAAQRPEWSSRSQEVAKEDQGLHAGTAEAVVAAAGEAADQVLTESVSTTKHYQVLDLDPAEREALASEMRSYADYIEGGLTFDTSEDEALYSSELSQDPAYAYDERAFGEAIDEYRKRVAGHEERASQVVMPWRDLADQVEQTGKIDLTDEAARLHVAEVLDNRGWQSYEAPLSEIPQPLHRIVQAVQEPEPLALPADVRHQRTESPRWDSQEARDNWAAEMVASGVDPVAVRAARTGDMSMSRPPKEATTKRPSSTSGKRPPRPQHHGQAQKPRR